MKITITLLITILAFSYTNAQDTAKQKFFVTSNQTSSITIDCPTPSFTITQPSCSNPSGAIVFTSPLNTVLPTPSDLFISEVTDEDIGSLSYVEIYNGTGVTKNLSNYKLKVFSNGGATATCDLALTGSLTTGGVFVIAMGSFTTIGGVIPNMVFPVCTGVNINDAISLTSSTNTLIDLWERTDGVTYTPAGAPGYTYRRLVTAVHPKTTWDSADWTALDPQDYTNVGSYDYQSENYQYSINGTNYQTSPSFLGLTPGTYQATVKDLSLGCISIPIPVTVEAPTYLNPIFDPIPPICSGSSAPFLPTVSVNGISGSWSPSIIDNQVSSTYVFTPDPGQCATNSTLNVVVYAAPSSSGIVSILVCDADNNPNDGLAIFDLEGETPIILSQQELPLSNYTVTFYTTLTNADAGVNTIIPATSYVGSNGQTIWVRVENGATGCYAIGSFQLIVYPSPQVTLVSDNTLNTVFVDGSNTVIQPLLLDSQLSGNYSYQWQEEGTIIPNASSSTYLITTASLSGTSRNFAVTVYDLNTYCFDSKSIYVEQSSGVPSPKGAISQTFNPGAILANITVVGQNILWYSSASNKNVTSTPLPLNTELVNGTTYYATQTIGGTESIARLPVTVHLALGLPSNDVMPLYFSPNPVESILTMQSNVIMKSVLVYNMLGQKVYEQSVNDTNIVIDLSNLLSGNYIARVQGETIQKVIKIVKQ